LRARLLTDAPEQLADVDATTLLVLGIPTNFGILLTVTRRVDLGTIKVPRICADDGLAMPNLYFCQPHAQNQGMLRAVISLADCQRLVGPGLATYVGDDFPKVNDLHGQTNDFAVLGISADEANTEWRRGYYRFEADLTALNAQLLALTR
jgi:hypothetical protein